MLVVEMRDGRKGNWQILTKCSNVKLNKIPTWEMLHSKNKKVLLFANKIPQKAHLNIDSSITSITTIGLPCRIS